VSYRHANGHSFKQLIREPKSYMDSGNPVPSLIEGVETISLTGEYTNYWYVSGSARLIWGD